MKIVYFAPDGFDYLSNQITEGLHLLERCGEISGFTCTNKVVHHGSKIDDLKLVGLNDAFDEVQLADLIIFSSGGDMSFMDGRFGRLHNSGLFKNKTVFIDGHDGSGYLIDPSSVLLYVKRELRYPDIKRSTYWNIRSLLFGVYDFHFDYEMPMFDDREYDVAFVAYGGSSPLRIEAANVLKKAHDSNLLNAAIAVSQNSQPLSIDDYRKLMRNSKVIVSIPGAGIDTLRFWEAMGFGAVLCSVEIVNSLVIRNAPEDRRHAVYFDNWNMMVELIRLIVNDKSSWLKMRLAADNLIRCHHSTKQRARQLIKMIKEVL